MRSLAEFIFERYNQGEGKYYSKIRSIMCLDTKDIPGQCKTLVPSSKSEFTRFLNELRALTEDIIEGKYEISQEDYIETVKDILNYANWWFDCDDESDTYGELIKIDDQEREMFIKSLDDNKNNKQFFSKGSAGVIEFMFA